MSQSEDEAICRSRIISNPRQKAYRSSGNSSLIDAINSHLTRHVGSVKTVWHEENSTYVHVDVHYVPSSDDHPYQTLVTSGMSQRAMNVERDVAHRQRYSYAELVMCLPPEWELSTAPHRYWPVGQMNMLARYPHEFGTWLWLGHSMFNGKPPKPYAEDNEFVGVVLLEPVILPEEARELKLSRRRVIRFLGVYPVYEEEMNFKLRAGSDALEELFKEHGVTELLRLDRVNVITGRKPRFN